MTTMPVEVTPLRPGTADARESEDNTASTIGRDSGQTEELNNIKFNSIERPLQYLPREFNEVTDNLGSAVHDQIQIGSLLDSRLRMREPLTLVMEQEGEFYIAKCDELNEFGYGADPIGSVQDVRKTIAELYWQLKENQDRLGSDLTKTWQRLSELVYEA